MAIIIIILLIAVSLPAQSQTITNFRFTAEATGWGSDFAGSIDNESKTITFTTQRWIENIAQLAATFDVDGEYEVKVGNAVQTSGVTKNDFRKDVVYTIGSTNYTVTFVSPQASGLPVINLKTRNNAAIASKVNYTDMASFALTDPNQPKNNISKTGPYSSSSNDSYYDLIRGRGNDSWNNPNSHKKSYRIRFNSKTSLFGYTAQRNWVLIAQYRDPTLLFNVVAFELGDRFNIPFNHTFDFVELYLNGDYKGNYMLTWHNQVNPGRVNIDDLEGWFIEMDGYYDEDPKFRTTKYELPVMIKSPEAPTGNLEDINNPFYNFVKREVNNLTDAVASPDFPESGYRNMINMRTFIDFMMIQEIVDNLDFQHPMSTYLYKDKGGLINMGPLWDFDCGYGYDYNYVHFNYANRRMNMNDFFKKLFDDPVFLVKYKERWNEKYGDIVSIPNFMDEMAGKLKKSAEQNFQTWWYRTFAPWTNDHPFERNDFLGSISLMKNWYQAHASYLNSELNKVEILPKTLDFETGYFNRPDAVAQKFTVVSYGETDKVTARLEKENSSYFEIAQLVSQPTGNGGYFLSVIVQPKGAFLAGTSSDVVIVTCENQGRTYTLRATLNFTMSKTDPVYVVPQGLTAFYGQRLIDVALPDGWSWMNRATYVGNVGMQMHKAMYTPDDLDVYGIVTNIDVPVMVLASAGITGDGAIPQDSPLKACIRNGQLHVNGLAVGDILNVYSVTGALVFQGVVTSGEMEIPLNAQGLYIIQSGNNTVKVVFD